MPIRIAMFNHKGGVSKTTTTFHLAWKLANKRKKVLMIDADPQCNLSGMILDMTGEDEFKKFYDNNPTKNIKNGLAPAFEAKPEPITAVDCIQVKDCQNLYLLPGHIGLSEYEVTLGIAQDLSSSIATLQNLPGAFTRLISTTAAHHNIDIVLVDMNPSLSSVNQNLLMTSDYFIVPTAPDFFSVMAINSLCTVLPRWKKWSENAQNNPTLKNAPYPFPNVSPCFLGTIIQKFRPRSQAPTKGFQEWIDQINETVQNKLIPILQNQNMLLQTNLYDAINGLRPSYCLAQIQDFNTLIAKSQNYRVPVFALTDTMLDQQGSVLTELQKKRKEFDDLFNDLAERILKLVQNKIGT